MKTLGIDVGSSSVKVSLMDVPSGRKVGSAVFPASEMPIAAPREGWAEQAPQMWWEYVCAGIRELSRRFDMGEVAAVGVTYQMHGLVCLDGRGEALRPAIIWCDSRAVPYGERAARELGESYCLEHTLNEPGNFTAAKMAWVREHEPETFARTRHLLLPGDYVVYRLTGDISTTPGGLSEQILWDFREGTTAWPVADALGIPHGMIPDLRPSIGVQARISAAAEAQLGIRRGTPVSYRAGDQPNNAFSLHVTECGEVAATAGTSGVVYGVTSSAAADPAMRVNTFLHVNHTAAAPRYGVLLCINGVGILNAWARRMWAPEIGYAEINALCEQVPAGSDGVTLLPFGNGAERMLGNRYTGVTLSGVDLNRHDRRHLLRAAQEGVACAFRYGMEVMRGVGLDLSVIRAGRANLFLSPLFRRTLASLCGASIELYDTDGSLGAARGAALGAGLYADRREAFASLECVERVDPDPGSAALLEACYRRWRGELESRLKTQK